MKSPEIFNGDGYVSFMFTPDQGEILSGVKSAYTDGLGRLHLTIGYEINKTKAKLIQKQNAKLRAELIDSISIKR